MGRPRPQPGAPPEGGARWRSGAGPPLGRADSCSEEAGVRHHGDILPPAGLRAPAHNIAGHACRGRRGVGGLVVPRRCGVHALWLGAVACSECRSSCLLQGGVVIPLAWLRGVLQRAALPG